MRRRFGSEDEVVAWGEVFDTVESGGSGEGEEVDGAEDVGGEGGEEDCWCGGVGHGVDFGRGGGGSVWEVGSL